MRMSLERVSVVGASIQNLVHLLTFPLPLVLQMMVAASVAVYVCLSARVSLSHSLFDMLGS